MPPPIQHHHKLLCSQLAQQSDHFSALFSLKPLDPNKGMRNTNPIVFPGVTAVEFDHICAFITGQFDKTVDGLAALLNLGIFLQIMRPQNHPLQCLTANTSWSPYLKLHLTICNHIADWAKEAFHQIVFTIPLEEISLADMLCIGGPAYWAIVRAKSAVQKQHRLFAFDWPEPIHAPICLHTATCTIAWKSEWWYTFAKCVLHPDNKFTPTEALVEVELSNTQYMHHECKTLTIQAVRDNGGLEQNDEVVEEALNKLLQFVD